MNKAVIPINDREEIAKISSQFARSPYFALIDKLQKTHKIVKNDFVIEENEIGKKVIDWLVDTEEIDTLIAFELGIKIQQIAAKRQLQTIILKDKNKNLQELLSIIYGY